MLDYRSMNKVKLWEAFEELTEQYRIEWKFIPAYAPWHGGVYERMIGIMKRMLEVVVHGKTLSIKEIDVITYEITRTLNMRPLWYYATDLDTIRPVSPMQMLKSYERTVMSLGLDASEPRDKWCADKWNNVTELTRKARIKWARPYLSFEDLQNQLLKRLGV